MIKMLYSLFWHVLHSSLGNTNLKYNLMKFFLYVFSCDVCFLATCDCFMGEVMLSCCQPKADISARPSGVVSCCAFVASMQQSRAGLDTWHASQLVFVVRGWSGAAFHGGAVPGLGGTHNLVPDPTNGQCSSTLSIPGHLQLAMVGAW